MVMFCATLLALTEDMNILVQNGYPSSWMNDEAELLLLMLISKKVIYINSHCQVYIITLLPSRMKAKPELLEWSEEELQPPRVSEMKLVVCGGRVKDLKSIYMRC